MYPDNRCQVAGCSILCPNYATLSSDEKEKSIRFYLPPFLVPLLPEPPLPASPHPAPSCWASLTSPHGHSGAINSQCLTSNIRNQRATQTRRPVIQAAAGMFPTTQRTWTQHRKEEKMLLFGACLPRCSFFYSQEITARGRILVITTAARSRDCCHHSSFS